MKTPLQLISLLLVLALAPAPAPVGYLNAQEAPSSAAPAEPSAPPAPETPSAPDSDQGEAAQENDPPGELRRLDVETPEPAPEQASAEAQTEEDEGDRPEEAAPDHEHYRQHGERFAFGDNAKLAADEEAQAVVSILGSSTSEGRVRDAVVSIMGNSRLQSGSAGGAVVSVLGNTYINGEVRGDAVAVLGDVELGPKAVVRGEVICVGGRVKRDAAAVVHGRVNNVAFGFTLGGFDWLQAWVKKCLILGRPLAFGEHLMWAWWLALGFLAFYVVLGLLFPRGIEKCARTFEQSPGYSILTALLVTLLTPLAAVVLVITVLGTPALGIALLVAGLFGKAAMLAWIGRRITNHLSGPLASPAVAVLIGGLIVLLLYTIPFVGFVVKMLLTWLGTGVVAYTIIQMNRRPALAPGVAAAGAGTATMMTTPVVAPVGPVASTAGSTEAGVPPSTASYAVPPSSAVPPVPPVAPGTLVVSAATMPRAGFWIRIAASALDVLIVAIAVNLMPDFWQPNLMLIFAAYCCVMWAFKGTTVGGIVCGLKIVRLDERRVDWPTAIVRALGGFLSLAAAGIGFIWVAFDDQKQSWHDKIAGTTIVHVPRGVSLV